MNEIKALSRQPALESQHAPQEDFTIAEQRDFAARSK